MEYLSRIIAALLDAQPTDTPVRLWAVGVQAQCLAVLRSGFSDRLGMIRVDESTIDDVASTLRASRSEASAPSAVPERRRR